MNARDIFNALNRVLDLGDQLDQAGGGVSRMTDGENSTREACKMELGRFLLYLASSSIVMNDGQTALLNLLFTDGETEIPADKYQELAETFGMPDPSENLTLTTFIQADGALSQQNGDDSTSCADILISLYKSFGQVMIAMNENALAQSRYDSYICQMESRVSSAEDASDEDESPSVIFEVDSIEIGGFEIEGDVLRSYTGNDVHVVVPEGIDRIDDEAFDKREDILTVTLPDSITEIGADAFWHCTHLENINLPEGLLLIEASAFVECDCLTSIDIPSTVERIGSDAFLFCNHLTRIRIPSTLADIGEDAFMYCDGLETVIVYGGKKDEQVLERLKEHFEDDVKIVWEGEEEDQPEPATTGVENQSSEKRNSAKQTVEVADGKYSDRVSFALPEGYVLFESIDDNGDRTVEIKVNPSINDEGETEYESTFHLKTLTPDGVSAAKSALDVFQENQQGCDVCRRFASTPEALISISSFCRSIFGVPIRMAALNLAMALSPNELLLLSGLPHGVGVQEDLIEHNLSQMETIWRSMSVDGRTVSNADMDINSLMAGITEEENADTEKDETPLDHQIRQDGHYLIIGGRWRMELPYGVRYCLKKRGEDERFDELLFELDRRRVGSCFLGDTVAEQRVAVDAAEAVFFGLSLKGADFNDLYTPHLRDDETIDVQLKLKLSSSGESAFEIIVTEKEYDIETRILMFPPCDIGDPEEALTKLKEGDYSDGHPFGYEWEQYWKIAVRMAASVSPFKDTESAISLGAEETIEGKVSIRMPAEMHSFKHKDNKLIYLPTTEATPDSFDHLEDYGYYAGIETGKTDMPYSDPDDQPPEPGIHGLACRMMCSMLERRGREPFAVVLHESVSQEGYKAVYLRNTGSRMEPDIFVMLNDGHYLYFGFGSDSDTDPARMIQIAKAVFDNIHYPGDQEATPIAHPRASDVCQEHMTLTESGSYTTYRDADFVGQPIRMLMEKCESEWADAYDLMQIPDDDYTLDVEARRLAEVFRLEEGMFDPYTDMEAMIRLGMFADARMFHALRSLAWTVTCQADREDRTLESYTFEELAEMCKLIDAYRFNYATESYCSGLCSHYDWHVFYVPDAYIGSDCESCTDLRELCGKENRGGNTVTVIDGLEGFSRMGQMNRLMSRNEETLESLEALRKDLTDVLPVMHTIYEGLMRNRDRSEKLEGVLPDALNAWCALAVAAKEPFYSEEATDSPEADAGLSGPMEQPGTNSGEHTSAKQNGSAQRQTHRMRPPRPVPAGDTLDLQGATVIQPGQFAGDMSLRNIVIPEGVTEIGERAFYSCMSLETVVLPKSLKKIGEMAFMCCRSLRQVEIPEGVEEICNHAFGATNNLREVHLPDSLQSVHRYIFGLGGDSPYATAYMSGELASRLQEQSQDGSFFASLLSAISARRYVIDGVGYENMYDYQRENSDECPEEAKDHPDDEHPAEMNKSCEEEESPQESKTQSAPSRNDTLPEREAVLSQPEGNHGEANTPTASTAATSAPASIPTEPAAPAANPNAKRIKELEESIAALQREAAGSDGVFGFVKRNRLKKEIEAQQMELAALKRQQP